MRTVIVGDIHGAAKALQQVLDKCNFDYENDTLIQLGDVADGWSEIPESVEILLKCKNLIPIRGNHDDWFITWYKTRIKNPMWLEQGGQATYDSYTSMNWIHKLDEHYEKFWSKQHFKYLDDEGNLFVHGGINRHIQLEHNSNTVFVWDRDMFQSALSFKASNRGNKGTFNISDERIKRIFIGHTSTTMWKTDKPININNQIINLDTGAGWNGKLTIMDLDTLEYWQSDIVKELYPNEAGRR